MAAPPSACGAAIFLANQKITQLAKCGQIEQAHAVFSSMPLRNTVSYNAMISAFAKNGLLDSARRLFDEMPQRNLLSWNSMIAAYSHRGQTVSARDLFDRMPHRDPFSFSLMITCYSKKGMVDKAGEVFRSMPDYIRKASSACTNAMISCYAKNGLYNEARKLFDELPQRSSLSFNSFLAGYLHRGEISSAEKLFSGGYVSRDLVSWNLMLDGFFRAGDVSSALELFKRFPQRNTVSFVTMLTGLCKFGMVDEAKKIFDHMPEQSKSVVAWNAMISGYIYSGRTDEAFRLFHSLPEKNSISFCAMISGFVSIGSLAEAESLLCKMPSASPAAQTSLLCGYARAMDMNKARQIFDSMMNKDSVAWNAMISGYAMSGNMEEALVLFDQMPEKDVVSFNAMIAGYLHQGMVNSALELFDFIKEGERDVVSWNSIISGLAQNGMFEKAMERMVEMISSGVKPDLFTISSGISACGNLSALLSGQQLHGVSVKYGVSGNPAACNALIAMYGRCGDVAEAIKIFAETRVKDIVSWNSLISILAMNGKSKEAVEMFKDMTREGGIIADEVTYVGVLSACSHGGLVEEGLEIFDGIHNPVAEHYACIVDLLARAERVEEAMEMVKKMQVKPTASVWGAILTGCRLCRNLDLAAIAAEQLAALEEERVAGNYVGLCNVAAEDGRWEEVERMRRRMREKKMRKETGSSWVEVNGVVNVFVVSDAWGLVLMVLQALNRQIKIEAECKGNLGVDIYED